MSPALVGDLVNLLAALFRQRPRVTKVLEQRQRRINRPWARRIHSTKSLFDFLDDFVAVSRLFGEQSEDDELEMPLIEHAGAAERTAARFSPARPELSRVEPEILGSYRERPAVSSSTVTVPH